MRLVWSERADEDRIGIEDYFGLYNAQSAIDAGDNIEERIDLLLSFPEMGREGRFPGTRELVVPRSQCVVIYRLDAETIFIERVLHGGQQWPSEL